MILIVSREEKELISRLRKLEPITALSDQVLTLKRQIADLEITKAKREEEHAREERELRHMIGLEKKRQEVEIVQAKKESTLAVREENLKVDKARFEEQLKFNTQRFETMEKYLKDMMKDILDRLGALSSVLCRALGYLVNLAGLPGYMQDCEYTSTEANTSVLVRRTAFYTVVSVDGKDIYFHRLSGRIDGIGGVSPRASDCT